MATVRETPRVDTDVSVAAAEAHRTVIAAEALSLIVKAVTAIGADKVVITKTDRTGKDFKTDNMTATKIGMRTVPVATDIMATVMCQKVHITPRTVVSGTEKATASREDTRDAVEELLEEQHAVRLGLPALNTTQGDPIMLNS